ncbi:MAG: hypothetical protein ACI83I_000428 [Bacteroidia bacterium]|jgi:hypothetical protein
MAFKKEDQNINRDGRPKGAVNAINRELRELYSQILNDNVERVQTALESLFQSDPAKALTIYLKISEFVVPKLKTVEEIRESEQKTVIILPEKDIVRAME